MTKTHAIGICRHAVPWLLLGLASCASYEETRIRQLMHEKGFGTRATGDSTRENYVSGLDWVQFLIEPAALQQPGFERLAELTVKQPVGIDGTIFVPYVGPLYALGKTELELGAFVQSHLKAVLTDVPEIQARIITANRVYYAIGEVGGKGRLLLEPDMTLVVHPNTYHPDIGYFLHGDSVRVTEAGCEVLCRTPRELFSVAAQ